jgi:hypothetical protein
LEVKSKRGKKMTNTEKLLNDWIEAKSAETKAQALRHAIEAEIAAVFEVRDEGAITHKTETHKVTLTQPIARSVDADLWTAVKHHLPPEMHPIKIKIEADAKGMKYLADNEPQLWAKVAPAFTTKPGKIGVKVEKL